MNNRVKIDIIKVIKRKCPKLKLKKTLSSQSQEAKKALCTLNEKRKKEKTNIIHIMVKLQNIRDKKKILKSLRADGNRGQE